METPVEFKTDWSKCCLCQQEKNEELKSPHSNPTQKETDGYSNIATNIPQFKAINAPALVLRRVCFTGHGSRVTGHWSQVTGHRSRVTGHRSRVTGHRSRVTGHKSQVTGYRSRVTGHGSQVTGHRSQVTGHRSRVTGHGSRVTDL
jgi:hypothetical protein